MNVPLNTSVVPTAAPQIDALAAALPRFETERLILRAPQLADWPALAPIWTTERSVYFGGPMSEEDGWLDFNHLVASWLLRGFGALTVCLKETGTVLGVILLEHEFGDPEPELGWLFNEHGEGHGYAHEAAQILLAEGLTLFGAGNFVSYVDARNTRSIRLAERLGAVRDDRPHPASDGILVFRHMGVEVQV